MSKSRSFRPRMTRSTKQPKRRGDTSVELKIGSEARNELQKTIQKLIPREKLQVEGRDEEFQKFLQDQYRMYCPELSFGYDGVPPDVMEDCVDWIKRFTGVSKKTDDPFNVDKRFDLPEGRSWVDQRRSKKIVPLFISWIETVVETVEEMKRVKHNLPANLDAIIVEKLLTTSYHPKSSQSNQTLLVCQQSLHMAVMRENLKEFGIVVPDNKKKLSEFISNLRKKVNNRRLGLLREDSETSDDEPSPPPSDADSVDSDMTDWTPVDQQTPQRDHLRSQLEKMKKERDDFKTQLDDAVRAKKAVEARLAATETRLLFFMDRARMEMYMAPPFSSPWGQNSTQPTGWFTPFGGGGEWAPSPPSMMAASASSMSSSSTSPALSAVGDVFDGPPEVESVGSSFFGGTDVSEDCDFVMGEVRSDNVPLQLPEIDFPNFVDMDNLGY